MFLLIYIFLLFLLVVIFFIVEGHSNYEEIDAVEEFETLQNLIIQEIHNAQRPYYFEFFFGLFDILHCFCLDF